MSFRFFNNARMSVWHTYQTFTELFNPLINQTWQQERPTVARWFMWLQGLYCRENLRDHFLAFFPDVKSYWPKTNQELYDQFIVDVPDDLLWMLYFMKADYSENSRTFVFRFCKFHPSSSRDRSDPGYHRGLGVEHYYKEITTSAELTAELRANQTAFQTYFTEHTSEKISWDYWSKPVSPFVYQLYQMFHYRLPYRTDEGTISLANVFEKLRNGVNVTISIGLTDEQISMGHTSFRFSALIPVDRNDRTRLYQILSYNTNPCNILEWPKTEPGEINPTLYGVELECSFDYNVRELIDAQKQLFFIAKSDSSVNGSKSNRAELVTIPMSLKAHKRHWAHWFKSLDYSRFDVTKDTNNGMHVHIDRKAFDDDRHIRNMTWFFVNPANKDFMVAISERGSASALNSYTPIYNFPASMTKVQAYRQCQQLQSTLRGVLNFNKAPTIEVRLFRGIVSFGELCKNLEFVDAALNFTRGEKSLNQLSASDFLKWLEKTPQNRYLAIKKFVKRIKNIDEILTACELYDVIFTQTDPIKISNLLKNSKLQVTNAHISLLNRGRKRTFVLDSETQDLRIIQSNRSRLAEEDRTFEARYTRKSFAA